MNNNPHVSNTDKAATIFCLIIGLTLLIGWPVSMIVSWSSIVDNDCRVAYMIADLGLVSPLIVASWIGLRKSKPWGSMVFLLAVGALSYDTLHFGIFLIRIKFLGLSPVLYVALIFVILLVIFLLSKQRIRLLLNLLEN
jgi:hypothetical protein